MSSANTGATYLESSSQEINFDKVPGSENCVRLLRVSLDFMFSKRALGLV